MNAQQTSVSAMFDSAFEGLAAPAGFAAAAPVVNPVGMPPAAAPPRKSIMKLALVVLATLGIAAALYLMFKKKTAAKKQKRTQKQRFDDEEEEEEDNEDASDDEAAPHPRPATRKPQKMTTFAPLDMPAVNFPVPQMSGPPQPQQPQNIRNSKGMRASEQIQGFPPPNIDVGLGSGTPPSMRPPPPPPSADQNFNPL